MATNKRFWIKASLINLCIVALLGFTLRSKILFPLEFIDYRNFLSAHSHFAFGGWVGLALMTLLIFDLLPTPLSNKKSYRLILWCSEISSLGMAFSFPFHGYTFVSIFFSSLYIFAFLAFSWTFISDMIKADSNWLVKLLSISSIASAVISFLGPLGLVYILISKSGNSILYRDSIYTFLHFQYNGFFTLAVFSLFVKHLLKIERSYNRSLQPFAICLCLSVPPTLFLSLLWHNNNVFYILAILGCVLIILSLTFLFRLIRHLDITRIYADSLSRTLFIFAFVSFTIKMLLHLGTVIPTLGDAIYGDRPVIIGFLHLVFLGFVTFYILSSLIRDQFFMRGTIDRTYPFVIFSAGIVLNEGLLMLQGLGILFSTNSGIFNWLLWVAAIILVTGAFSIAVLATKPAGVASGEIKKAA